MGFAMSACSTCCAVLVSDIGFHAS